MRVDTQSGVNFSISKSADHLVCVVGNEYEAVLFKVTKSEALELAAELVKLAMPDAKPDTAPVSIM